MAAHDHPLGKDENVKVESVITATEYAGEGCEEHYNERTVVIDPNYITEVGGNSKMIYGRAIIIGEALATPRCKR